MRRFAIEILVTLFSSLICMAETCNSTGEYEYRYGDSENLKEAKAYCERLAIRAAIEECALYVQSITDIRNYELKEDLLNTIAVAFVKRKKVIECKVDGNTIFTRVSVTLDDEEMKRAIEIEQSRRPTKVGLNESDNSQIASAEAIYSEDFSTIEEGLLPTNWIGGSTLGVCKSKIRNYKNCVAPFGPGKHDFTIPNVNFPANWKFDMQLFLDSAPYDVVCAIRVGGVKVGFVRGINRNYRSGWLYFNDINTKHIAPEANKLNLISIEQQGLVVKLFLNGEQIHTIRLSDASPPRTISFSYGDSFAIYQIKVTDLGGS